MSNLPNELLTALNAQQSTMLDQLHHLCKINSSSYNLSGLQTVRHALTKLFNPIADQLEIISFSSVPTYNMNGEHTELQCGDALFIRKRPELQERVLLSGHMDTVFPMESTFQNLTDLADNRINGPGVADMKGGLIVMLHALSQFEQMPNANNIGWDVLINADEELGSPASGSLLNRISGDYRAGLVYEPATLGGNLAKNRKGSGKLTLIADGKAAHAGRSFDDGRNAICYLAEAITAIHGLNGKRAGVTINIGLIKGGDALNSVPDKATCKMDIRIEKPDDQHWVLQEINTIIEKQKRPDYRLTLHGGFHRPVKIVNPATNRLYERIRTVGQSLNLNLTWQDTGGCCDGNNLAENGLAVIDTLGVRGGLIHSHKEYIETDSLVERACLSALVLADLASGGLQEL